MRKIHRLWAAIHEARAGGDPNMLKPGLLCVNLRLMLRLREDQCQTCRVSTTKSILPGRTDPLARTRGHLCSIRNYSGGFRHWITQCGKCNHDQGALSFYAWMEELREAGDPRIRQTFATFMAMLQLGIPLRQIDAGVWVRRLPQRPVCSVPMAQAAE